jgi:hypothetical protein
MKIKLEVELDVPAVPEEVMHQLEIWLRHKGFGYGPVQPARNISVKLVSP